jgi:hypothetical protein
MWYDYAIGLIFYLFLIPLFYYLMGKLTWKMIRRIGGFFRGGQQCSENSGES